MNSVVVIGLGSMGKRRISLLQKHIKDVQICGVDLSEERQADVKNKLHIETFSSLDWAVKTNNCDMAFICTSPLSHSKLIDRCLDLNLNVFTEINLVSDLYEENIAKAKQKELKLFLSSTFLYRKEVQYIKQQIKGETPFNYIYHTGQYLPDWHPWENYKNFFVNEKRTNGCREIFAIELPWIVNTFGAINDIHIVKSKMSGLDVNYDDNYIVTLTHEKGHKGVMIVDIVSRKATRSLELYSDTKHITWQGKPDSLYKYDVTLKSDEQINLYEDIDKKADYAPNIIENAYADEIKGFFDYVNLDILPRHSFEEDLYILDIIDKIEE